MRQSLTQYDLPVIMQQGWKFGMADTLMWNTDKNGVSWQMLIDDGEFLQFAYKMSSHGPMSPFQRLTHEEYADLFQKRAGT